MFQIKSLSIHFSVVYILITLICGSEISHADPINAKINEMFDNRLQKQLGVQIKVVGRADGDDYFYHFQKRAWSRNFSTLKRDEKKEVSAEFKRLGYSGIVILGAEDLNPDQQRVIQAGGDHEGSITYVTRRSNELRPITTIQMAISRDADNKEVKCLVISPQQKRVESDKVFLKAKASNLIKTIVNDNYLWDLNLDKMTSVEFEKFIFVAPDVATSELKVKEELTDKFRITNIKHTRTADIAIGNYVSLDLVREFIRTNQVPQTSLTYRWITTPIKDDQICL